MAPPTNWASSFTGTAWERIGGTDEYYLHLFCKEQADLNWENPEVREELKEVLRFWKGKGVKGFRFDVVNLISKPAEFIDDMQGERIMSRIFGMCQMVHLGGKDYRAKGEAL